MSGAEVIGIIAGVVTILETSVKIYDDVKKNLNLSKAFETVRQRLPILLDTLKACKAYLGSVELEASVEEALEEIVIACRSNARKLEQVFDESLPGTNDKWEARYIKTLKRLGKGHKVEELMLAVTKDVQVLVNHQAVTAAAKQEQKTKINEIIEEVTSMISPVSEEPTGGISFNSGGGPQDNRGNFGNGPQNWAPVRTQVFGNGKDHPSQTS